MKSITLARAAALAAAMLCGAHASAQGFPTRPITMIAPYAPGASADVLGRVLAQKMGEELGASSLATSVSLTKINFDPRKDLVRVAGIAAIPSLLVVWAKSPLT